MEEGDYLLGVSPQGVYFVKKDQTITKTKINFDDIDTLGLLAGLGNVYVFHIISKHNDEINIIVDSNQSLLVSPIMLFNKMLKLLDAFIESGGAVTDSTSRRRRVSVPSSSSSSNGINTGASQESSNNRVIDISYSTGVLEEMRTATYVGSNRNIEIDTPVSTEVVHEEADSSRFVEVEKSEDGSKRNIDLDDIIGSRMADVRKNIVIEDKANPVINVPSSQSQTELPNPGYQKEEIHEPATSKEKTHETEELDEEQHESVIPKEKTQGQEMSKDILPKEDEPKGKKNTSLIIGLVAVALVIATIVGFWVMKSKKDTLLKEQELIEQMTDPYNYPWLHGEWQNGVYGDILDVYFDGVKFIKNGLVFEEEEWSDDERPRTMKGLANVLPHTNKVPYEIIYEKTTNGKSILALQFNNPREVERTIINIDTENQRLFYLDKNGKKVFLDKYSDFTFEEKWNKELAEANQQLTEDLASHHYDWLYGTWLDYSGEEVVVDKDYVYYGDKRPFELHYELEDPYNESLDYGLYLYLSGIPVNEAMRCLYFADEYSIMEYQKVSNETAFISKVYSNAYDGFVNIRQAPESKAPIIGVLRNGPEGAVLLGTEGEWKKIDCNGIVGYVYEKYVQDTPTEVFQGE